jgi:hypothetical protein
MCADCERTWALVSLSFGLNHLPVRWQSGCSAVTVVGLKNEASIYNRSSALPSTLLSGDARMERMCSSGPGIGLGLVTDQLVAGAFFLLLGIADEHLEKSRDVRETGR